MAEETPLSLLLRVMRERFAAKDLEGAVALAKVAAPYVHGRALVVRVSGPLAGVADDELDEWAQAGGGDGAAAEADDPGEPG